MPYFSGFYKLRMSGPGTVTPASPPVPPDILTPIVGDPSGQMPNVHVRDTTMGWDLYTRNPDTLFNYPASVVKLMTVLLAYEYHVGDWTSTITVAASDCGQPLAGLTLDIVGLDTGDVVSWEQLAYAILLPSAGDACQVVARKIGAELLGGSPTDADARIAFVARMNARAAELDMDSVFTDAFGGCQQASPPTIRNQMTARDMSKLCEETMSHSALRTIAQTAVYSLVIASGPNPRTLTCNGYSPFTNGPYFNRQGVRDTRVEGGKNGVWELDSMWHHNCTLIWTAPNGNEIVISTLDSKSPWGCVLDQKGIMYSILRDFPYLWDESDIGIDPLWTDVKVLLGDGLIDESDVGRTVTLTSVTEGDPVIAGSTGAAVLDALTDAVGFADAADLSVGADNMCVEQWYAGPGAAPASDEWVFFSKWDGGQKEWVVDYYQGFFQIFASADGSGQSSAAVMTVDPFDRNVFFNGAPRHIAYVKDGSTWACYLNGERMSTTLSIGTAFDGTAPLRVGLPTVSALGRVDDFRFTSDPRYTDYMVTLTALPFPRAGNPPPPPPPPPPIPPPGEG